MPLLLIFYNDLGVTNLSINLNMVCKLDKYVLKCFGCGEKRSVSCQDTVMQKYPTGPPAQVLVLDPLAAYASRTVYISMNIVGAGTLG